MNVLHDVILMEPAKAMFWAGLAIGFAFGFLAAATNFCVMGAISDWRTSESPGRLGAVALAMAVAIAGTQALSYCDLVDLTRSMYLQPRISWAGALIGGALFGFGMVFAGGCASRNIVRLGHGDLRALFVLLILSAAAFATISGVLATLRFEFEEMTAIATEGGSAGAVGVLQRFGVSPPAAAAMAALALIVPLVAFAFLRADLANDRRNLAGGIGAGLLVAAGWLVTGLAFDEMAVRPLNPSSLSFVRPVADAVDWVQRATALGLPGFGAASIFGALTGSFTAAFASGHFRLLGFAGNDDLLRHIAGAIAMGIGGVLALGCSIGQGLTGLSTLSVQSMLAVVAIGAGANMGLSYLERRV